MKYIRKIALKCNIYSLTLQFCLKIFLDVMTGYIYFCCLYSLIKKYIKLSGSIECNNYNGKEGYQQ